MNATGTVLLLSLLGAPPADTTEPLCAKREPCRVVETLDGGQDDQGQALRVKRLSLGWTDLETGARFSGSRFGPEEWKAKAAPAKGQCEATEWWLLHPQKPAQLLLSLCKKEGKGAVREEKLDVGNNGLGHERSGARRGERWTTTRRYRLSPLKLTSDNQRTWRVSRSTKQEKEDGTSWDFETLSGTVTRAPSECQPGESSLGQRTLPYLPQVEVDKAYLEGGWKQAGLGDCALEAGHFLPGLSKSDGPQDAWLKALLVAEDTLIIEVSDEKVTGPGANWLNDDHVELWLAPLPPQELTGCGEPTEEQLPVQWGIRIADGQVFPGFGTPQQTLQVERAQMPGGHRLKVKLPIAFLGIGVVYSDSDTGKKPEAKRATSELKSGRPETLNPVYLVYPREATCTVKEGKLSIVRPELKTEPDKAVLQME